MPALTKKKKPSHRTSTGRRASNTGRAKKDIGAVARFARDHSTTLKALGWVLDPAGSAARAVISKAQASKKDSTRVGTSKGGRGSEKKK